MQRRLFFYFIACMLAMAQAAGAAPARIKGQAQKGGGASINILSIIPAQGAPGISVTLYGSGFTDDTVAFLGNQQVPTVVLGPKQLSFEIPKVAPGLYALFLKREDGVTSKIYNFTLLPQKPVATGLSPDNVDICASGRDREVTINGQNFQERSQVLFDGAAIHTQFLAETSLSFMVPQVPPGLHQVQIKNAEDTTSVPLGLQINGKPEITGVSIGEQYVNYYNLVIEGKNFQQGSSVVVMEDSSFEQSGGQATVDTKRIGTTGGSTSQRERVTYVNCNRILYQRYPYSTMQKSFRIQVVNPNGEESSAVSVSAP